MTTSNKTWIEIALMPLVVALVGIVGTFIVTQQQVETVALKADEDRQVKLLEMFIERITDNDAAVRMRALSYLEIMDSRLAWKLATAAAQAEPVGSPVKQAAERAVAESDARIRGIARVYLHIRNEQDRAGAEKISELLEQNGFVVPGIQRVDKLAPNESQVRYFQSGDQEKAQKLAAILKPLNITVSLKHIGGYTRPDGTAPANLEIWFAPGEPKLPQSQGLK